MEFFAKAHAVKNANSSQKDHKSEDKVKRQLKKMLQDYKQSNRDLIKNLVSEETDDDDSSSVSGFSDLNLTDSSFGGRNDTQETISPKMNVSDFNESNLDKGLQNDNEECAENDSPSVTTESISEYEDNNQSLSGDLEDVQLEVSDSSNDLSLDSSLLQSSDNESEPGPFDNDGTLAHKIKDKINKIVKDLDQNNKIINKKKIKEKKTKKRKVGEGDGDKERNTEYRGPYNPNNPKYAFMEVDETDSDESTKILFMNQYRGPLRPKDIESDFSSDEEIYSENGDDSQDNSKDNLSPNQSPDFISVTANDMPSQSIDDILGDYKHPTIKNLPCESQNIVQSTRNSGMFVTDDWSFTKVVTEEDADSLVPEVADDIAVEDIELEESTSKVLLEAIMNEPADDTDLDTSTLVLNESEQDTTTQLVGDNTAYDETLNSTGQDSDKEMSVESVEATFVNPVKIYYGKNCCVFVLKHPTDIYIHGKVKVRCLGGTIEVLGYTLKDSFYEVYAPQYNVAQYLRTVENENAYYGLFGKLTSSGLLVPEAEEIVTSIGDYDGIICLQPLKKRKMDFVEKYFTAADLFTKVNRSGPCFQKASEKLSCTLYSTMPWRSFSLHPCWKQVLQAGAENQSRGIICGGKGVGKSTFLRYYINKRLAQGPVLLIDLDPGQCELTVAGNVSATVISEPLLGPNFTHLKTPDIMLNLGMINTMDNPRRYARAVEMLISHCHSDERLSKLPWIVNTMGMCNGMGLKFISLVIINLKPTFLLQIDAKNPKHRFESFLRAETIKELFHKKYQNDPLFSNIENADFLDYLFLFAHRNESLVRNNFSLAPRDERYLNFLAYFGELVDAKNDNLLGVVPYEVSLKDVNIGTNVKINEEDVAKVINGKTVALCNQADCSGVFTLGDKPIRCYGHGLIRGIDWENETAYILSPVNGAALADVNTLVYADWAPEVRGQEDSALPDVPVPYRTMSRYDHRQLTFPPKRRFNPLQLLKIRAA